MDLAADSVRRLLDDPRIGPKFSMMIVVHPESKAPDTAGISQIAALMRLVRRRIGGRIAVVVSGVGHATPAEMISLLSDSTEVFQDESAAMEWIFEGSDA